MNIIRMLQIVSLSLRREKLWGESNCKPNGETWFLLFFSSSSLFSLANLTCILQDALARRQLLLCSAQRVSISDSAAAAKPVMPELEWREKYSTFYNRWAAALLLLPLRPLLLDHFSPQQKRLNERRRREESKSKQSEMKSVENPLNFHIVRREEIHFNWIQQQLVPTSSSDDDQEEVGKEERKNEWIGLSQAEKKKERRKSYHFRDILGQRQLKQKRRVIKRPIVCS